VASRNMPEKRSTASAHSNRMSVTAGRALNCQPEPSPHLLLASRGRRGLILTCDRMRGIAR
jgi:hypothetical protein